MKAPWRLSLGLAVLAAAIVAENLFGRELNVFFLRFPGIDKVLHTIEYTLLTVCVYGLVRRTTRIEATRLAPVAIAVAVTIASLDEWVQRFFPARSVETLDFIANLAGIALGWVVIERARPRLRLAVAVLAVATSAFVAHDTYATLIDYSRALRYERDQDFVRAREHLRRAYTNGLRTPALLNELAWVEIESGIGDPVKAVEYATAALEKQPRNPDVLDTYGWALLHAGRTAEALAALQNAYTSSPDMYCIHYHLGAAYLASNQFDRARHHFGRQIEKSGTREAVFARQALARLNESHHE